MIDIKNPPVLNINGTNPQQLLEQYNKAHLSLLEALGLMREAMPHGRDYPRGDYDEARKTYLQYVTMVKEASSYMAELTMVVYDQKALEEDKSSWYK